MLLWHLRKWVQITKAISTLEECTVKTITATFVGRTACLFCFPSWWEDTLHSFYCLEAIQHVSNFWRQCTARSFCQYVCTAQVNYTLLTYISAPSANVGIIILHSKTSCVQLSYNLIQVQHTELKIENGAIYMDYNTTDLHTNGAMLLLPNRGRTRITLNNPELLHDIRCNTTTDDLLWPLSSPSVSSTTSAASSVNGDPSLTCPGGKLCLPPWTHSRLTGT